MKRKNLLGWGLILSGAISLVFGWPWGSLVGAILILAGVLALKLQPQLPSAPPISQPPDAAMVEADNIVSTLKDLERQGKPVPPELIERGKLLAKQGLEKWFEEYDALVTRKQNELVDLSAFAQNLRSEQGFPPRGSILGHPSASEVTDFVLRRIEDLGGKVPFGEAISMPAVLDPEDGPEKAYLQERQRRGYPSLCENEPTVIWSNSPGFFESQLQQRHNNPLFPLPKRCVSKYDVYIARQLDSEDHSAFVPEQPGNCPKCNLINPVNAEKCDCGYDFQAQKTPARQTFTTVNVVKLSIGLILIALQVFRPDYGFTSSTGPQAVGYNLAAAAFYACGAYLLFKGIGLRSILIAAFCGLSLVLTFVLEKSQYVDWASSVGALTGTLLLASLAVAIYYKVKKPNWAKLRIASSICFWTLILSLIRYNPGLSKEDVPRLMSEAAGRVPISQPDNDEDKVVRDVFREVIALRKEVADSDVRFETPEMANLLKPVSFSTQENVENTLAQLRDLQALSLRLAVAPGLLLQHLDAARSKLGSTQYASSLKEFQRGFENSITENTDMHRKELKYIDAEIDLYGLVLKEFPSFVVKGHQVFVSDSSTLEEYNSKLSAVRQLAADYQSARKDFEARQNPRWKTPDFHFLKWNRLERSSRPKPDSGPAVVSVARRLKATVLMVLLAGPSCIHAESVSLHG
jgi:hypothetical protein